MNTTQQVSEAQTQAETQVQSQALAQTVAVSQKKGHVIDYIAQLLDELSEMAADIGHTELADLIRFSGRAAVMEKTKLKPEDIA